MVSKMKMRIHHASVQPVIVSKWKCSKTLEPHVYCDQTLNHMVYISPAGTGQLVRMLITH